MNLIHKEYAWNGELTGGNEPREIINHHADKSICTPDDIHAWHLENGWVGIGYHYFIRKDGTIYTGRPEWAIGAHTKGHNATSIGICYEGKFTEETMPEVQKQAGIELIKDINSRHSISSINEHKDFNNTDCPGDNFPFAEIKAAVYNTSTNHTHELNLTPTVPEPQQEDSGYSEVVAELQQALNDQGFTDENENSLVVDGYLGKHTRSAASKCYVNYNSSGDITRCIQKLLLEKGYKLPLWGADGVYGREMYEALTQFQRDYIGIGQDDGVVGPLTWEQLLK